MTYPQWLKDPDEKVSYARVVGFFAIMGNLVWRLYMGVDGINSWPSAVAATCGCWTGIVLWGFEVFRNYGTVSVKFGEKEYGAKLGTKTD